MNFITTSDRFTSRLFLILQTSIKYHIQCTFHINVARSIFQGYFFVVLVVHGLSIKDKDPLLAGPVSPYYLNSFKPSQRNHGQGFLAYFVIHSAPGKSVSCPVMPLGQLVLSCCFDWLSIL